MRLLGMKGQPGLNLCFNCVFLVGICSLLSTEWSSLWCVKAPCLKLWLWTEKSTIPCTGGDSWMLLHCNNLPFLHMPMLTCCAFSSGFCLRTRAQHMCTTDGNSTPSCRFVFKVNKSAFFFFLVSVSFVVISALRGSRLRARRRPSGGQTTSGCLRTAPCGARLLLIHTSTVLTMTVTKRRTTRRAVRKAV